jgi:hypothetical protein
MSGGGSLGLAWLGWIALASVQQPPPPPHARGGGARSPNFMVGVVDTPPARWRSSPTLT